MIETEPYYEPVGVEIAIFEAAWRNALPVLFKGPDRLWQDALHGAHGVALETSADHGLLP